MLTPSNPSAGFRRSARWASSAGYVASLSQKSRSGIDATRRTSALVDDDAVAELSAWLGSARYGAVCSCSGRPKTRIPLEVGTKIRPLATVTSAEDASIVDDQSGTQRFGLPVQPVVPSAANAATVPDVDAAKTTPLATAGP